MIVTAHLVALSLCHIQWRFQSTSSLWCDISPSLGGSCPRGVCKQRYLKSQSQGHLGAQSCESQGQPNIAQFYYWCSDWCFWGFPLSSQQHWPQAWGVWKACPKRMRSSFSQTPTSWVCTNVTTLMTETTIRIWS